MMEDRFHQTEAVPPADGVEEFLSSGAAYSIFLGSLEFLEIAAAGEAIRAAVKQDDVDFRIALRLLEALDQELVHE